MPIFFWRDRQHLGGRRHRQGRRILSYIFLKLQQVHDNQLFIRKLSRLWWEAWRAGARSDGVDSLGAQGSIRCSVQPYDAGAYLRRQKRRREPVCDESGYRNPCGAFRSNPASSRVVRGLLALYADLHPRLLFKENGLEIVYESANNDLNAATYLFCIGSRHPDKWKDSLPSTEPILSAGSCIGDRRVMMIRYPPLPRIARRLYIKIRHWYRNRQTGIDKPRF